MSVFCDGLLGMRCAGLCPLLYRIRCMRPFVSDPQPAWDRFCSALCSCGDRLSRAFCLHETGSSHLFTKVNKKSQCALSGHFICRKNAFPIPFFISFNRCAPGGGSVRRGGAYIVIRRDPASFAGENAWKQAFLLPTEPMPGKCVFRTDWFPNRTIQSL